jgi:hypothetical protein
MGKMGRCVSGCVVEVVVVGDDVLGLDGVRRPGTPTSAR